MGPMSEIVGRRIIYNYANLAFCGFTIGCALAPSLAGLIVLRFLQGCAASCNLNNAAGTIADLISIRHRGFAMSMYSAGFMLSPVLGPIIGSLLSAAAGWRWIFWLLSILVRRLLH
jgi:multidrug resistance protein